VFDDTRGMISLEIDVDESKQFYVSSINVVGLDEHSSGRMKDVYTL